MEKEPRNSAQWLARPALIAALLLSGAALSAQGQQLPPKVYSEDFEGLALGPNRDEAVQGVEVWTKTPPAGWTIDDSRMPGVGDPAMDGVTEWAGWSFAKKDFWVRADNQTRSTFNFGQGTLMIADPDEWDDAAHAIGLYFSYSASPVIGLTNRAANSLVLVLDSSWRPEGFDDRGANWPTDAEGNATNNQTGIITGFIDGVETKLLHFDSQSDGPFYHPDSQNEFLVIPLNNPAGAQNMTLKFSMEHAANDWWWAVDNIAVGEPPFAHATQADGLSFAVRIAEGLGKTVNQSAPITLELDGAAAAPVEIIPDVNQVMVKNTRATLFQPRSRHTARVRYTTSDGVQRDESLSFVAPGYTEATATPTSVTATITETDWMVVDETRGVQIQLDGAAVSGVNVTRADTRIVADFSRAEVFAPKSTHTLQVTFTTVGGEQLVETVSFITPDYLIVPARLATAAGTGAQPGMRWKTHQLETARAANLATIERQLAGELGASVHDITGQEADGYYLIDFVNFDENSADAGNFKASAEAVEEAIFDSYIPGIPGTTGSMDQIAGEARAFLEFTQAGLYTMVVNSDDGFQVTMGTATNPKQIVLGQWDATRGSADTRFYFRIDQPGVYFTRLVYFEGTGGANVEWFTVNPDGTRALVGGQQTGSLKAYRVRTVGEPVDNAGISSITRSGSQVVIQYTGTLKSSATVLGPFENVSGASSPHSVAPDGAQRFFLAQ